MTHYRGLLTAPHNIIIIKLTKPSISTEHGAVIAINNQSRSTMENVAVKHEMKYIKSKVLIFDKFGFERKITFELILLTRLHSKYLKKSLSNN